MTWNLRLVEMSHEELIDDSYIEIREVFYDYLGKPLGHCTATVGGENIEEIKQYVGWMKEALKKPILKFDNKEK